MKKKPITASLLELLRFGTVRCGPVRYKHEAVIEDNIDSLSGLWSALVVRRFWSQRTERITKWLIFKLLGSVCVYSAELYWGYKNSSSINNHNKK